MRIFCVSFSCLAAEVMLIRWVGAEVHVFAYFKNLILMACFLGMGVGCAQPVKDEMKQSLDRTSLVFPFLMVVLVAIVGTAGLTGLRDISLLVSHDLFDFSHGVESRLALVVNVSAVCALFILTMATFDFVGRELGKELCDMPPLPAYTSNLLGSLAGVIAFFVISYLSLPPAVWVAVCLLPMAPLYLSNKKKLAGFLACTVAAVALGAWSTAESLWSPYYRIDLKPLQAYLIGNDLIQVPYRLGTIVEVNHTQHQRMIDLSRGFIEQHRELTKTNELRTYDLPYSAIENPGKVLVLGAGTGNDVSAALRHNAGHVDAVEIDPEIYKLGTRMHPEKPYADPRVTIHLQDARAFLAASPDKFDLITFGHLDSQTALSTMSSVRLDNYLYTLESLAQATSHLSENGIASVGFATQPDWLRARIYQMVQSVSNQTPIAFNTKFDSPKSIMVMWGPGLNKCRDKLLKQYKEIIADPASLQETVILPTDDWPFLYQRPKELTGFTLFMLGSVLAIASIVIFSRFKFRVGAFGRNLQFLLLGAGFLLMETRAILAVAILFESTWIVNSLVIGIVLLMALLANYLVMKFPQIKEEQPYAGLLVSLLILYAVPMGSLAALAFPLKLAGAAVVLGLPFLFSGLVFAKAYDAVKEPEIALGVNIFGAVIGALLENLAVVVGINGVTLVAVCVYALSYLARSKASLAKADS